MTMIKRTSGRRAIVYGVLLATTAFPSPALAQDAGSETSVRAREEFDENGVNLATGEFVNYRTYLSIGPSGPGGLQYTRARGWSIDRANFATGITGSEGSGFFAKLGIRGVNFVYSGGSYVPDDGSGATLVVNSASKFTVTKSDGTTYVFDQQGANDTYRGRVTSITYPTGEKISLTYVETEWCTTNDDVCDNYGHAVRLQSVSSSLGYLLHYDYANNEILVNTQANAWKRLNSITAINTTIDACAPNAATCTYSRSWPTVSFAGGGITDAAGNTTTFSQSGSQFTIRRPSSATANVTVTMDANNRVSSVVRDGLTWDYGFTLSGTTMTLVRTDPLNKQITVVSDTAVGLPTSITNELGHVIARTFDAQSRLTRLTQPEGNYVQLTYDTRGNVTQTRMVAKAGSGLADIVTSATFPASCASSATCNQPTTTTDEGGFVTDYSYNASTGTLASVTEPAPTTGGIRPQTRYAYTNITTPGGTAVSKPQSVSECQATASCTGAADESKTTYNWSNQLLLTSITRANGTGTLTSTTVITNDSIGNASVIDGPLSSAADSKILRYDNLRRLIGMTTPDPDGAGAMKMRAVRRTYNVDGDVAKVEFGTVNSASDSDWAAMSELETQAIGYDDAARPNLFSLAGSDGVIRSVTQTSYDGLGRLECEAVRNNSAVFGSLPASACTLGTTGSVTSDQIARTTYDDASQVTQVQTAYGTAGQKTKAAFTYTANGNAATLKDAENNLTTYEYDGHDRLEKTRYPVITQSANASSTTDFEQLTYDSRGNAVSQLLRDGTSIALTYDARNRVTLKNLPGTEPDVSYAYDNLGRLTSASQTSHALSFTYDALSRNLTQVGPQGTVTSEYDAAGRRTKITYPASSTSLYVNYDYLVTGDIYKIRQNGETTGVSVLATYAYDNLGNQTSLTLGNGVVQASTFDPVSRLATLTNNLSGSTNDLSASYGYSPASQIVSRSISDNYAWTGAVAVNRGYAANGRNQYTAAGPATFTYDARGNLTGDGTSTFGYSSENLLTSGPSASLTYDPFARLYQVTGSTTTTRFAYDGLNMIAEYNASNALQRRFVFAPGLDRPIAWYEGSTLGTRRFFSADERGSIISVTDYQGSKLAINTYDEYGIPGSGNMGRFQYTGQAWIPELGLYYYKARFYSPTLGRFMQTDPIGTAGGINLYGYVGNDPANFVDPLGLCQIDQYPEDDVTSVDGGSGGGGAECPEKEPDIVVNGQKIQPASLTTWEMESLFQTAKVDRWVVNSLLNSQQKQNIRNNLRKLLGDKFTDAQIESILSDILSQQATTIVDLAAFRKVIISGNTVTLTSRQKSISDRFVSGLPGTRLNIAAKNHYAQGLHTGRIKVK